MYGYATVFGCAHIVARVGYYLAMDQITNYVLDQMRVIGNAPVVFALVDFDHRRGYLVGSALAVFRDHQE